MSVKLSYSTSIEELIDFLQETMILRQLFFKVFCQCKLGKSVYLEMSLPAEKFLQYTTSNDPI